jgi:hypothetical protein
MRTDLGIRAAARHLPLVVSSTQPSKPTVAAFSAVLGNKLSRYSPAGAGGGVEVGAQFHHHSFDLTHVLPAAHCTPDQGASWHSLPAVPQPGHPFVVVVLLPPH